MLLFVDPLKRLGDLLRSLRRSQTEQSTVDPAAAMDVWYHRIMGLTLAGRSQDVIEIRELMYESLPKPFKPLNPTIHDVLSQILLAQRNFSEALVETNYGLQILGDDIFLLHRKGLILTEQEHYDEAKATIDGIIARFPSLAMSAEIAGIEGRIYRAQWQQFHHPVDLDKAIDAYSRAFREDVKQFYPAINVAELLLMKGDTASVSRATQILEGIRDICEKLREDQQVSYWVDFTLGEAYLGLSDLNQGPIAYRQSLSRSPLPNERDWTSAMSGMQRMVAIKGISPDIAKQILAYRA